MLIIIKNNMEKFFCNAKKISLSKKSKIAITEKIICCLKENPLSECVSEVLGVPLEKNLGNTPENGKSAKRNRKGK